MKKPLSQEEFIKRLHQTNKYFKEGTFKLESRYAGMDKPIIVSDRFGNYKVKPLQLCKGFKPSLRSGIKGEIDYYSRFLDDLSERNDINGLTVGLPQHYTLYKSTSKDPINNSRLYTEILRFMFTRIWNYIFKENWIFKAPLNFGEFYVAESFYRSEGESMTKYRDWVESVKQGKIVYKYNLHTMGRKFFIKWNKYLCKVKNGKFYRFIPYRGDYENYTGKRGLTAWIKKCSEDPYLKDFRGHII